jgi:hypothetical protein
VDRNASQGNEARPFCRLRTVSEGSKLFCLQAYLQISLGRMVVITDNAFHLRTPFFWQNRRIQKQRIAGTAPDDAPV